MAIGRWLGIRLTTTFKELIITATALFHVEDYYYYCCYYYYYYYYY